MVIRDPEVDWERVKGNRNVRAYSENAVADRLHRCLSQQRMRSQKPEGS